MSTKDQMRKAIKEFEETDCDYQEISWRIRLDSLQQIAYRLARGDIRGDHALGIDVLNPVFEEIERLFTHYTVISIEEGFRDIKFKKQNDEK